VFPDVVTVVVRFDVVELVRLVEVLVEVEFELLSIEEIVVDELGVKDERLNELEVAVELFVLVAVEVVPEEVGRVPL